MSADIFINFLFQYMETIAEERSNFWRNTSLILIGLLIGYMMGRFELTNVTFRNDNAATEKTEITNSQNPTNNTANNEIVISPDDDPYMGSEDAKVTIIDFSDYQCPFSAKFNINILPQLEAEYIKTGKVKYVFRDFPLNIHPKAQYAHYAAECAKEQNKYWEMNKILFEKQSDWSNSEKIIETFSTYAAEIGMNKYTFEDCLTSEKHREEVEKDKNDGISYGIKGTPTIIVNNKIIRGISTYDQFKQLIEKEL